MDDIALQHAAAAAAVLEAGNGQPYAGPLGYRVEKVHGPKKETVKTVEIVRQETEIVRYFDCDGREVGNFPSVSVNTITSSRSVLLESCTPAELEAVRIAEGHRALQATSQVISAEEASSDSLLNAVGELSGIRHVPLVASNALVDSGVNSVSKSAAGSSESGSAIHCGLTAAEEQVPSSFLDVEPDGCWLVAVPSTLHESWQKSPSTCVGTVGLVGGHGADSSLCGTFRPVKYSPSVPNLYNIRASAGPFNGLVYDGIKSPSLLGVQPRLVSFTVDREEHKRLRNMNGTNGKEKRLVVMLNEPP